MVVTGAKLFSFLKSLDLIFYDRKLQLGVKNLLIVEKKKTLQVYELGELQPVESCSSDNVDSLPCRAKPKGEHLQSARNG